MSKKVTTEDFIERAKAVHGDIYDYSKLDYVKAREKATIICKTHGEFLQTPNAHLCGRGCSICGHFNKDKWNKDKFIEELRSRCGDNLPYSIIGEYKGTEKNILIENEYGVCSVRANHLLKGVIPSIETAINPTEYWINRAIKVHQDTYDYSKVLYLNSGLKVKIGCGKHGIFEQTPNSHLSGKGCPKCKGEIFGLSRTTTFNSTFIEKANKTHNYKYKYEITAPFKAKDNISIICPNHGKFIQIADNHLRGDGCQKCAISLLSERMRESPTGWSYTNWQKAAEKSKNFDSFKIYIIRCWKGEEQFYKIGKTFTTVDKRFKNNSDLPYNYEIVKEIVQSVQEICELEWVLKKCNKLNKYEPKNKFSGMYECFKDLDLSCFDDYKIETGIKK